MSNGKLSNYLSCSNEMKTGDLLQWREDVCSMRLWRWITRSKVNHSSMVLRLHEFQKLEKRRFTTESRFRGTVLNLLSRRFQKFYGEVWWYPLMDDWDPHRQRIAEEMLKLIGIPYNFAGLVKLTLRRLFGAKCRKVLNRSGFKGVVRWMNDFGEEEVFCSEYCYRAYKSTGHLTLDPKEPPSPDDMLKLGIFKGGKRVLGRRKEKEDALPI